MREKFSQFFQQLSENTTDLVKEKERRDVIRNSALSIAIDFANRYAIGERLGLSVPQLEFFQIHFARYELLKSIYDSNYRMHTPQVYAASKLPIIGKGARIGMAVVNRVNNAAEELRIEASLSADFILKGFPQLHQSLAEIQTAANRLSTVFVDHHSRFNKDLQKSVDQTLTQISERHKNNFTAHREV